MPRGVAGVHDVANLVEEMLLDDIPSEGGSARIRVHRRADPSARLRPWTIAATKPTAPWRSLRRVYPFRAGATTLVRNRTTAVARTETVAYRILDQGMRHPQWGVYADGVTTGSEPLSSIAEANHGARPSDGVRMFEDSPNGAPTRGERPAPTEITSDLAFWSAARKGAPKSAEIGSLMGSHLRAPSRRNEPSPLRLPSLRPVSTERKEER